jgi:hypothetical protein
MNSTKKQYVNLGSEYPTEIGDYLLQLEKIGWNLRHDYIYVMYRQVPNLRTLNVKTREASLTY